MQIPELGISPLRLAEHSMAIAQVQAMDQAAQNYSSLEEDPEADALVEELRGPSKAWVDALSTHEEVVGRLIGVQPMISRLGLIAKHKHDSAGNITSTKERLILDAKASRANDPASTYQIITRPTPLTRLSRWRAALDAHRGDVTLRATRACGTPHR